MVEDTSRAANYVVYIRPRPNWWDLNLAELWEYRELLYFFIWRDVKVRYKQTVIGALWAILQPFMTMVVFTLIFGKLARMPSYGLPYPIFYYSALLPWMYFASSLQQATNVIVENQRIITKVYFPRLILPLSAVLSSLVTNGASLQRAWKLVKLMTKTQKGGQLPMSKNTANPTFIQAKLCNYRAFVRNERDRRKEILPMAQGKFPSPLSQTP